MAMNPMQRKARNSFLLGMLTMLVIAAIIIAILFMQILGMKKQEQQTATASKEVYVLTRDVKSGEPISTSDLKKQTLVTDLAKTSIATIGEITENTIAKIDLGKGSILSKEMIVESDEATTSDLRIEEYNMITLPTDLQKEDYIDIRIIFPNGQNYIVVSKKRVLQLSEDTIFVKMTEAEILTMTNAIVESYITTGSSLYATKYVDAGIQNDATPTYTVSKEVLGLINEDPNITQTAREALWARYKQDRRAEINTVLNANMEDAAEKVEQGITAQKLKQEEERLRYIEMMGGVEY